MARRDDLDKFATKHDLNIVYISDIVEYRLANEILVHEKSHEEISFFGTKVQKYLFVDHEQIEHTAIIFHSAKKTSNVKVHNVMKDIDLLLNQAKYKHLIESIEYLKQNSGILIFINNPSHEESTSMKEFGVGAQILKTLGVEQMHLITSSKQQDFVGLGGFGLEISDLINL